MASNPPSGWLDSLTASDIGHGILDVAGLVPVIGEAADFANAAWLATEGDYLGAGLSVISMIPIVGDAIGKGGKLLGAGAGKLAGPALDALKKMDFQKALGGLRSNPKIGPHVDKMIDALEKWRAKITGQPNAFTTPTGTTFCPLIAKRVNALTDRLASATGKEAEKIADEIAQLSTHSAPGADRVVLGKWPGYIEEAKKGGTWYESPPGFYDQLKDKLGDAAAKEKAWLVNEAFLRQQMAKGKLLEITDEGIAHAAKNAGSAMAREIEFLAKNAPPKGP